MQKFAHRLLGVFAGLCLCISAAATTTVTGTLKTLGTGNITSGAFVRFYLRGCAGNQPRVNGTALIGPTQGAVFYFDIAADSSGNISGSLYSTRDSAGTGNGDIECGGSKTGVWYGMQTFQGGRGGPEVPVHAKSGVSLDITSVTPITTTPVVTAPTGDTTYLRLDNGNNGTSGTTYTRTADKLSAFSATTSTELASVLSDETGSGGGFMRATSPTTSSPVINGTPTGTGIQTKVQKVGTGSGNYTSPADTNFHDVDASDCSFTIHSGLCATLTIPVGWVLTVDAVATVTTTTAAATVGVAILDTSTLIETQVYPTTLGQGIEAVLTWNIVGDGASHTIKLQFKTFAGADSAIVLNSSSTFKPVMHFTLAPSN